MTEEQNEELLPCPFCGSDHITELSNRGFMYVRCEDCRTQTRGYKQYAEARAAWNRRVETAEWTSEEDWRETLSLEKGWYWYISDDQEHTIVYYNGWRVIFHGDHDVDVGLRSFLLEYITEFSAYPRFRHIPTPPLPGKEGM